MSQISLKSISGITSITTPAGVDNQFTLHTNNTSQALKLDSAGNIHIHNHVNTTGVSTASNFKTGTSNLHSAGLNAAYVDVDDFVDVGSNIQLGNAGVVTATSFSGSGANLTGIDATALKDSGGAVKIQAQASGAIHSGISTFNEIKLGDNKKILLGTGSDLEIYHSGSGAAILNSDTSTQLTISSDNALNLTSRTGQEYFFRAYPNNRVELYYDFSSHNTPKLQTSATGVTVDGTVTATNIELAIPTSRRNFFINGGMYVAARGTVTGLNAGGYGGPDHIKLVNNLGAFTVAQGNENDSPRSEGFTYSYKLNCTTASGPSNSNYVYLNHAFSGYDLQLLKYGYTNPHPITISFWAKSNKTGNFTVTFRTIAGVDRLISKVFTISNSNWNFYSATFVGDTSAVNVTGGQAYLLEIWLDGGSNYTGGTVQTSWSARSNADRGAGSTLNIASSTSNYFYYTGLQVELGAVATPFEHQLYPWYEHECYRYFYHPNRGEDLLELHGMGHRVADTMGAVVQAYPWPRRMRATPTLSFDDNNGNSNRFLINGSNNSTYNNQLLSLQQNDQGIMGAFQYPHGLSGISENESFRMWAYNFKAEAEF